MISAARIPAHAQMAALMAITRKQTVHAGSVLPDVYNVLALIYALYVKTHIAGEQLVNMRVTIV